MEIISGRIKIFFIFPQLKRGRVKIMILTYINSRVTEKTLLIYRMPAQYSNIRAALAIAKASLLSMFRSPTAVVFSLLFPIIFIVVFGSMVDNAAIRIKVAVAPDCDTSNIVYKSITAIRIIRLQTGMQPAATLEALKKGQITALLNIKNESVAGPLPHYGVELTTANASMDRLALLESVIRESVNRLNEKTFPQNKTAAEITVTKIPGRIYRQIDFILPGQLGFSLLMAGVFSSAFLLFSLRQGYVLKRVFATPITRGYLILGELLSRLFFQVIGFIIMVALGYYVFDFTLVNGMSTFLEMLSFSILGLLIFMGIGFIISGVTENESSIAPIANTITLPQILLCGLFFPVDSYPHWLQSFCRILPLTFFVDGLRKIAFEGTHIWQMPLEFTGLLCWTIAIGILTVKVFRWE
jgi:ABC-2 type transport system permease protein